MTKKLIFLFFIVISLVACRGPFKGVEGVTERGKVIGGSPSKNIRKDIQRTDKRQQRRYKREMKKRAKRMGTTKDR